MIRKDIFKPGLAIILTAALFALFFAACLNNDDNYSLGDIWLSLGFIDQQGDSYNEFNIITDYGDTLVPIANAVPYFETYNGQRVLANYTVLDDANDEKTKRFVRINSMQAILYKSPILIRSENEDSIGNDEVSIKHIWVVDNVLNIKFIYAGGSSIVHFINLVYEQGALNSEDSPIELELRHNANNDIAKRILNGIVSFDISMLESIGQDSIEFEVKAIGFNGNEENFSEIYTY